MRRHITLVVAVALAFTAGGCRKKRTARVPAAPRAVAMPHIGDEETGTASWYGYPYHGRRAANGEIYDMEKLTAAHCTMPFGTILEVTNLGNGRVVTVRITDRGPFVGNRIIDLSKAAARQIQMIGPGIAKVRLRVVGLPGTLPEGFFAVQVGAFQNRENAEKLRERMEAEYGIARISMRDGAPPLWRVLVGRETSQEQAAQTAARLRDEVGPAFVVRVDASESNL